MEVRILMMDNQKDTATSKKLRTRAPPTTSNLVQSDEEGLHDHLKCLKKISVSDKLISKLRLENTNLKKQIKIINNTIDSDIVNENKQLKELLEEKERQFMSLQVKYNTENTISNSKPTVGWSDSDNMEILTPLKYRMEKSEKENLTLAIRIEELEYENKELLDLIKKSEPPAYDGNSMKSNIERMKELEKKSADYQRRIRSLTCRLNKIIKNYANLSRRYKILKQQEISLSTIQQSIKDIEKRTSELKAIVNRGPDSNIGDAKVITTADVEPRSASAKITDPTSFKVNNQTSESKPKMLLLSDLHGTEVISMLARLRRQDYDFAADIINFGTTDRVLHNVKSKTEFFTKKDCLVIMCGGSDCNVKSPVETVQLIEETVKSNTHCNIIVCTIPMSVNSNSKQFNYFVNKVNAGLILRLSNYKNVMIKNIDDNLTIDDYNYNGYSLKNKGKFKVATALNVVLKEINERMYNSSNFL